MSRSTLKYIALLTGLLCIHLAGAQPAPKEIASTSSTTKEANYSFTPPTPCKKPPQAPPPKLLNKKFMVGGYESGFVPNWHHVDLNGDGICDWLRDGIEQSRYDQESPTFEGSIILGTSKGWRVWKPANVKFSPGQFFNPLAAIVYRNNDPRAIVVFYSTLDASTPSVDLSSFTVTQWSDQDADLRPVDAMTRVQVLAFLKRGLCVAHPKYSVSEGVTDRITAKGSGTLCGE